ncbi:response regulator transcription factor [Nitriliruptor alkaliphilus]|uniref:response regulator transcription factor n=1 Tax=Nitriliruptor alkaliphilus TaxID=427918 RepID=UPI000698E935|nr:response regulator [Nitriliruptor alkaliphilus]
MSTTTILVADDQADLRRIVRILLTRGTGWEVIEAVDGDDAVEVAAASEIDAAVLDHRMPGRTGIEVAQVLRADGFTGPIVIFSAYLEPDLLAEAERLDIRSVPKGEIAMLNDVLRAALADGA